MAAAKNTAPKKRPTPEKRDKTSKIRAARNKATKSALKTALKKAYVGGKDRETVIRYAIKRVDQACAKGILHKNNAARKKSQLMRLLNKAV
ncbi:MAG: 30S ribosomal protein S20 [Oscillospiraceae bacterium]|nr:30S ribosomal protein S20 [Oscillospiraceae bacterium]MBQ5339711.1 30S ribosomal protein S20 [Oscillospiraceae bacterium]MBQ9907779.1 30S ribosomal protein S20 [Oscillospiraceae bacterium]MBR5363869.1 30S ribosomal protein S20 [Oscillospiraceae bacterium]